MPCVKLALLNPLEVVRALIVFLAVIVASNGFQSLPVASHISVPVSFSNAPIRLRCEVTWRSLSCWF